MHANDADLMLLPSAQHRYDAVANADHFEASRQPFEISGTWLSPMNISV